MGLLSDENYGKTDDFYFVKRLLSRTRVMMISTYQRAALSDEAVCIVRVEQWKTRMNWMICIVSIKLMRQQGSIQQYNTYAEYKKLANNESKAIFGGRLGEYKYYDMWL